LLAKVSRSANRMYVLDVDIATHVCLAMLSFWGYTLEIAAFTLNRVPTKSGERTPYEIWTRKHPGLSFLKVWGCEAYIKRLMSDKFTLKSDKCLFVEYPRETK
jgi:hypothetical protein